jgi:hypothetical protein
VLEEQQACLCDGLVESNEHRITSDVEKGVASVSKAVGSHRCCNLSKQCRVEVHLVKQHESSALGNAHVRVRFDVCIHG